ncbi:MAG: NAD(P)/FAD-dependent oxidoreductase [Myxococcota bacterium]
MDSNPDVVIVGGRPAGSTLAARLGARGVRVLLVDKAAFPSLPAVPSSPTVHPGSMKMLDELGIAESSYSHVDGRMDRFVMEFGDHFRAEMSLPRMHGRAYIHGVDRRRFDHALWRNVARFPSVTQRERCTLVDVLRAANGQVCGVVLQSHDGTREQVKARCVVGADGRFSVLARKVDAPVVTEKPDHCSTVYYADWEGVTPATSSGNAGHVYTTGRGTDVLFFLMPDGRTSINTHQRADRVDVAGDAQGYYVKALQSLPGVARRLKNARQVSDVVGVKRIGNGYRQASGAGWALVGDALHYKDPVDGQGIYDALLGARLLDEALAEWLQGRAFADAMAGYRQRIHAETWPMFNATTDRLRRELYSEPPVVVIRTFIRWMMTDPLYQERFLRLLGRDIDVDGWMSPGLVLGAAARGLGRDLRGLVTGRRATAGA